MKQQPFDLMPLGVALTVTSYLSCSETTGRKLVHLLRGGKYREGIMFVFSKKDEVMK